MGVGDFYLSEMNKNLFRMECLRHLSLIGSCSIALSVSAMATDFSWKGKTYREVKIVAVSAEGEVTLVSRKEEEIVVPRGALTGFLVGEVDEWVKEEQQRQAEEASEERPRRGEARKQDQLERCWIYGPVSDVSKDGIFVFSRESFLPSGKRGADGELRVVRKTQNGVNIYNGLVFLKGVSGTEESHFDRVLWRDGYVEMGLNRVPAFSPEKPKVTVPVVAPLREWTNQDNRKLTASVNRVEAGRGQFVEPGGRVFTYEIDQLCADDRAFLAKAIEEHAVALRRLQEDYPWLELK